MSESYDQQVNHVRIIDRQVNDARIIGPETTDSSCSLVSSVCSVVQRRQSEYLIDASEDLCSVWLHKGAGCHGLVGPGSARRWGRRSCFFLRAGLILSIPV